MQNSESIRAQLAAFADDLEPISICLEKLELGEATPGLTLADLEADVDDVVAVTVTTIGAPNFPPHAASAALALRARIERLRDGAARSKS